MGSWSSNVVEKVIGFGFGGLNFIPHTQDDDGIVLGHGPMPYVLQGI